MRLTKAILLLALFTASSLSLAAPPAPPAEPDPFELVEPKIVKITKKKNIRVVYDVKDDVWDAGIGKALYYARGLVESYKALGVDPKQRKISVVLHGPTAYWVLKDDPYRTFKKDEFAYNPNTHVIQGLLAHGVSVEVCNVTLRGKGWTADDVLPGITIVRDAYTRMIDLQQQGYSYIRF